MKKIVSLLLSLLLIVTAVPSFALAAAPAEEGIKENIGKYYKFTFGEGEDNYDYQSHLNKTITYKGNTFYPFWQYQNTGWKNKKTTATYKNMTDSSGTKSVPVLEYKSEITSALTLLTKDGKPFEVEPGKRYAVKVNAYLETEANWSHVAVCLGNRNTPTYSGGYSAKTNYGSTGASSLEKIKFADSTSPNTLLHPVFSQGFTRNNGNNWATKHYGDKLDTAYKISKTVYFSVPDNARYNDNNYAVYDSVNDSYTFNYPDNIDAEVIPFNNYLTLFLAGGKSATVGNETIPFTYSIESVEVYDVDNKPDLLMYVGDTLVKTVKGENRDNIPYFIPRAKKGEYFSGWYSDKNCTQIVNTSSPLIPQITKLYAGFKKYPNSLVMNFSEMSAMGKLVYPTISSDDSKGVYLSHIGNVSWLNGGVLPEGYAKLYNRTAWNSNGNLLAYDKNGDAFVAEPYTSYKVSVEYKVNDIVTSEEVGVMPNGKAYPGGYAKVSLGCGMNLSTRRDLADKPFIYSNEAIRYETTTDWLKQEFSFTTGSLNDVLPVIGVRVGSGALPPKFSGTEIVSQNPADLSYGSNSVIIRQIKIEKNPKITFKDANGQIIKTKICNVNEKIDFSGIVSNEDVILENGKGYTVSAIKWYRDKGLQNPVDINNTVCTSNDSEFYADVTKSLGTSLNQVSYYGFEDFGMGETLTAAPGYLSKTAVKLDTLDASVNITPNAKLDKYKTYRVSFFYKAPAAAKARIGAADIALEQSNEWKQKTVSVTSENEALSFVLKQGNVTIDSVEVTQAVALGGVSILKADAEAAVNKQAIRVYANYLENENIIERGLVLFGGEFENALDENTENAVVMTKTNNFDSYWQKANGKITYSNYLKNCEINDSRIVTVRAYIKTADGNKFYSEQAIYSVEYTKNLAKENVYNLTDNSVLDLVKIQGPYQSVENGITFDWTANAVEVNAYCFGNVDFNFHYKNNEFTQTYTVYVDGVRLENAVGPTPVDEFKNLYKVSVDVGNEVKVHNIKIVRRSEVANCPSELENIVLSGTLRKVNNNNLLVEFIGDSITCGYGNVDKKDTAWSTDGTSTYAYNALEKLSADYRIRSLSGIGFKYNSGGGTGLRRSWLDTYEFQNAWRDETTPYKINRQADVFCIYLGTNDCYNGWKTATGNTISSQSDKFIAAMKDTVNLVKKYNPDAKVVWIGGGMTTAYMSYAETAMSELGGEAAGYYTVILPGGHSGGNGHPNIAEHKVMGDALYNFFIEKGLNK